MPRYAPRVRTADENTTSAENGARRRVRRSPGAGLERHVDWRQARRRGERSWTKWGVRPPNMGCPYRFPDHAARRTTEGVHTPDPKGEPQSRCTRTWTSWAT